jgi:ABC-type antimicrobial peptide transport system permease subunit
MKVLIRTSGSPLAVIDEAKARINGVDPSLAFEEIVSMADVVAQSIGGRGSNKLLLIVATIFGTLSLTFAAIGIYGVVAHNVTQRLREIGIRVALGASRAHVVRIVVGYALRLLVGGLALGVTIAWAATRGMKALLFATQPFDPLTYAAVLLVLSIAALIASAIPLRRALDFNPTALFRA